MFEKNERMPFASGLSYITNAKLYKKKKKQNLNYNYFAYICSDLLFCFQKYYFSRRYES